MDRALGIEEKASLDKASRCGKALWFVPIPGKLFDVATHAIASWMKLQMNWMILLLPRASAHGRTPASNPKRQTRPTAETLERSMDIAIGRQSVAPRSTAFSSFSRKAQSQLQPTPDELAYSMDIAIGERVTVLSSTVAVTSESQSRSVEVPHSDSAPQWLRGRAANNNQFHPSYRRLNVVALQSSTRSKPLTQAD
jgi:hypothetical protein